MSEIENRSEIVFLYDVSDANPNGDPIDEDKPRIDQQTDLNIVTDVRLKRTIRDYLRDFRDQNIFIQSEKVVEDGEELLKSRVNKLEDELKKLIEQTDKFREEEKENLKGNLHNILGQKKKKEFKKQFLNCIDGDREDSDKKELLDKFAELRTTSLKTQVLSYFIDMRLFGATLAVKNLNLQQTGPTQFKFGRSLHKVDYDFYKGSITMPVEAGDGKEKGKTQAEFSQEYRLPYSLIGFYGIVNENAAKYTGLEEEDVDLLMDGIWNGTKNLITRSKVGQVPRFLMRVVYEEDNYHIGDLDKKIKMVNEDGEELDEEEQKKIRSVDDYILDIDRLMKALEENEDSIKKIDLKYDSSLNFDIPDDQRVDQYIDDKGLEVNNLDL